MVVGFNFGFAGDKNDPKCNMGFDSDTLSKKYSKQLKKLKFGQKFGQKSKMGFQAYNSKGVDKNGATCNMGFFGRITKIYPPTLANLNWPTLAKHAPKGRASKGGAPKGEGQT